MADDIPLAERPGGGGELGTHLDLLAAMAHDFASSLDVEQTLVRAITEITHHMNAAGGVLFLLQDGGQTLRCHACAGVTDMTGMTMPSDLGIVGRCVQGNAGEIVRDAANDPAFFSTFDEQTGFTTRSILCAPMSVQNQRIGAIELVNKRDADDLFEEHELQILEALCASAALAVLNARQAEGLVEQEKLRRELELAAEIQRSLLPRGDSGLPVHGINIPARTVSGDFFDYFLLPDGRICFNLGDVSGKGMNAALLMAKTVSLYRCLGKQIPAPGRVLQRINEEICETVTRGMFVTLVGGLFDPSTGTVRLANAGHEPPLIHHAGGGFSAIAASAPPVGITPGLFADDGFPETEFRMGGGTLYIFTDGVTEGLRADGQMLEVDGIKDLIVDNINQPLAARIGKVIAALNRGGVPLRDDLTILGIEDRSGGDGARPGAIPPRPAAPGESLFKMRVAASADRLKLVRAGVREVSALAGFDSETVGDIVLAVDEACQNIIRHAYKGGAEGDMELEVRLEGGAAHFLLRDFADPVNATKVKPRPLDDVRPGGLGTHLIREIMDQVDFVAPPEGGGNLLSMIKRLP